MITSMSDIICVTSRKLCGEDFTARIERIAAARPRGIILREKDMSPREYAALAEQVRDICAPYGTPLILHSFWDIALRLGIDRIHLPLQQLRELPESTKERFTLTGASCHSAEEAAEAERLGADYIIAGHIFATGCKPGLPPRGTDYLREVCSAVDIPVYAIGGISPQDMDTIRACGAAGGCIMSGLMRCEDPAGYLKGERQ